MKKPITIKEYMHVMAKIDRARKGYYIAAIWFLLNWILFILEVTSIWVFIGVLIGAFIFIFALITYTNVLFNRIKDRHVKTD